MKNKSVEGKLSHFSAMKTYCLLYRLDKQLVVMTEQGQHWIRP